MPDGPASLEAPRGMRDFYPADMDLRNAIFDAWTRAARQFGFAQYDACVVESLDLLKRKSGEEIVGQIYAFQDKSGRDLALRPEMTPTLARLVAARQHSLTLPLKWFAIAQCFRYERMSRGRKREHYQWNLDIVGEPAVAAEAETLACAFRALDLLGLEPGAVRAHYNSRALLGDLLTHSGLPAAQHPAAFLALDKRGKIPDSEVARLLAAAGLDEAGRARVFQLASIQSLDEAAAQLPDSPDSVRDLRELERRLEDYGLAGRTCFDLGVVRGLDYYTGIVFEAFDEARQLRAIFGGGRYNRLLQDLGGQPLPAVGLGFGDVVIAELLAARRPPGAFRAPADLAVGFMAEAQRGAAIRLAQSWRGEGRRVDLALRPEKAKNFFSRAARDGAAQAVFIGPDDLAAGAARLKNLADRSEQQVPLVP